MQDTIQRQILSALLIALRPLARALLRAGIGFREFEEISKTAFVDIATKDFGIRGRPTNISRVAVMTGLTRKEVRRLRDKASAGEETVVGSQRGDAASRGGQPTITPRSSTSAFGQRVLPGGDQAI